MVPWLVGNSAMKQCAHNACQEFFEPKRRNQVYCTAACRKAAARGRWPLIRLSMDEAARLKASRTRRKARTSFVTKLPGRIAHKSLRTLLWLKNGEFTRTWQPGARSVLKVDAEGVVRKFDLLGRLRNKSNPSKGSSIPVNSLASSVIDGVLPVLFPGSDAARISLPCQSLSREEPLREEACRRDL